MSAQAFDRVGDRGVDLIGQANHEGECFHIAVSDSAPACAQDEADEGGILVVLDLSPWTFGVNVALTARSPWLGIVVASTCGLPGAGFGLRRVRGLCVPTG